MKKKANIKKSAFFTDNSHNFSLLLVLSLLLNPSLRTTAQNTAPLLNSLVAKTVVDSLVRQINKYYVFKETSGKISTYLTKRYDEGAYNKLEDPYALSELLTSDVQGICHDEHFNVEYNPELANEVSGNIEDVPKMVAYKLEQEKQRNYGFKKVEVLNGNIGYLEVSYFSRVNKYSRAAADLALNFLSGTRAIVIDLRYGKGGSPDMVNYIAGHFFKSKTHIADIYIRSENSTLQYWTTPDSSYKPLTTIPLYILTSYRTFSAAEGLSYALQGLKRAQVIGEATRGGAHTVTYKPLSNGFVCDIPFGRVTDPVTKQNWEGKGVQPDVRTTAEEAPETAELMIIDAAIVASGDSSVQKNLLWQKKVIKAIHHAGAVDTVKLRSLAGRYGLNQVSVEGGALYFHRPGLAKLKMLPFSEKLFRPLGNDAFLIEFNDDATGKARLTILHEDGRTEQYQLSN